MRDRKLIVEDVGGQDSHSLFTVSAVSPDVVPMVKAPIEAVQETTVDVVREVAQQPI
jgi:hypothetical protein